MKLHRFYVAGDIELEHDFWLHDQAFLQQWNKVLRFKAGQEVVLFDGQEHDKLYRIDSINEQEAHLQLVTEMERKVPTRDIYLLWALLKKDKNDWVLQKCAELGVSHFVPLLADRSEKTGFRTERAQRTLVEAAEQCGRSDIPHVREPMHVETALDEFKDKVTLYVCEQEAGVAEAVGGASDPDAIGLFVGPEGGWSDDEKSLFQRYKVRYLDLHDFTLRAETAAVVAVTKLLK